MVNLLNLSSIYILIITTEISREFVWLMLKYLMYYARGTTILTR